MKLAANPTKNMRLEGGKVSPAPNILLIEDDESLRRGIAFTLQQEGFSVLTSPNLLTARPMFKDGVIDLILLDIALPDGDGFQFCQEIRTASTVPIVFLSACDQEVDIVMGYRLGADDYITKPFSLAVLVSKINAVLRRGSANSIPQQINSKDILFSPRTGRLSKRGIDIALTPTEMKIFRYFISNPQQIITREQFLAALWDIDGDFIDENTLPVNIRRLREKIEDHPSQPDYIKTIRGAGYIWAERCSIL